MVKNFIFRNHPYKLLNKVFFIYWQYSIFATRIGGLAQLARAFAWHARGHRFDSDILHTDKKGFTVCKAFFIFR
jgi:hypothetical protein